MSVFLSYIKNLSLVRHLCFAILASIVLACIFGFFFETQDAFKYGGFILQLLGIATVVLDLNSKRKAFDLPTYGALFTRFFKPSSGENTMKGKVNAPMATSGGNGSTLLPPDTSLEDRLSALESTVASDRKRFTQDIKALNDKFSTERSEREHLYLVVKEEIKQSVVDNMYLQELGVLYLFFWGYFCNDVF